MQQVPSNGSVLPSALSASKSSLVISDPIPGAKPLPVPPELAPFVGVSARPPAGFLGVDRRLPPRLRGGWGEGSPRRPRLTGPSRAAAPPPPASSPQRLSAQESTPVMNGVSGPDGEDYSPWADRKAAQPKTSSPPQSQSKLSDSYSNTLPVRKSVAPKNSYAASKGWDAPPGHRATPDGGGGASRAPSMRGPLCGPLGPRRGFPAWPLRPCLVPFKSPQQDRAGPGHQGSAGARG